MLCVCVCLSVRVHVHIMMEIRKVSRNPGSGKKLKSRVPISYSMDFLSMAWGVRGSQGRAELAGVYFRYIRDPLTL